MANENATPPITLRIIGALRDKLNELANAKSITPNRYVEDLVRNHLENPNAAPVQQPATSQTGLVGLGGLGELGGIGAYIEKSTKAAQLESEVNFKQREIDRLEREIDRKEEKISSLENEIASLRKKQNMGEVISGVSALFGGQKALPPSGGIAGVEESEEAQMVKTLKANLPEAEYNQLIEIVAGLAQHPADIARYHAQMFRPSNG